MTQKVFISSSFSFIFLKTRNAQVTFEDKPQIKMKSLKKQKHKKIIHACKSGIAIFAWRGNLKLRSQFF